MCDLVARNRSGSGPETPSLSAVRTSGPPESCSSTNATTTSLPAGGTALRPSKRNRPSSTNRGRPSGHLRSFPGDSAITTAASPPTATAHRLACADAEHRWPAPATPWPRRGPVDWHRWGTAGEIWRPFAAGPCYRKSCLDLRFRFLAEGGGFEAPRPLRAYRFRGRSRGFPPVPAGAEMCL